jgi:pantoate kinase
LRFPQGHVVICGYLGPISTRDALAQSNIAGRVNPLARRALEVIRRKPDLRTFLKEARVFGAAAGFQTPGVSRLIRAMISAGAIGAAQNMIGEAVHGVVAEDKARGAFTKLRKAIPACRFFVSRLDDRGVRLVEPANPKH